MEGHAGYAEAGFDIICAAVSALAVNCVNSVEQIAGDRVSAEEREGFLACVFPGGLSHDGSVLMESMLIGLRMIAETTAEDGEPFLNIRFKED